MTITARRAYSSADKFEVLRPLVSQRQERGAEGYATPGIKIFAAATVSRSHRETLDGDVREYVSTLWAEDWDSPEDEIYDTW